MFTQKGDETFVTIFFNGSCMQHAQVAQRTDSLCKRIQRLTQALLGSAMRAALVELNMLLAAQSPAAWQRPCSAGTLCDYFAGRWSLRKEMSYVRGGISGTFSGDACFHRMGDEWLAYAEQGKATLGEEGSKPQIFEASRRLLYDCSQPAGRVECYFDEATDRTPTGVRTGAKFFHEIELPMAADAVPPFEHPCGPDLYRGKLIFAVRPRRCHFLLL